MLRIGKKQKQKIKATFLWLPLLIFETVHTWQGLKM
jgi:hypothetical protein